MRVFGWPLAGAITFGLAGAAMAQPGGLPAHPPPLIKMAQHWKAILGPRTRFLSGPARSFVALARSWQKVQAATALVSAGSGGIQGGGAGLGESATRVSLPGLHLTRFFGTTQSETSTAWCGRNAVIGFNDSGSLLEDDGGQGLFAFFGLLAPTTGFSYAGYARSANANNGAPAFSDKLQPPPGPVDTLNEGDPVVVCGNPSDFWLANLYVDASQSGPSGCGFSEVTVQTSTDGGSTFGAPSPAVEYDGCYYLLDKDWMAINPSNPSELAVSYTNFNSGNYGPYTNDCGAPGADVLEVDQEVVVSTNGGASWSSPTVVTFDCGGYAFNQGSQVAFDPSGNIFDAWEEFASNNFKRSIQIAESTDGGASFGAPVTVRKVKPVGDSDVLFGLQGSIRDFEFPSLVIGKPGAPNAGELYITWNNGSRRVADQWMQILQSCCSYGDGKYGFGNVLVTSSTDHGASWSKPVRVNAAIKAPTDHFQPVIASGLHGALVACWYDRNVTPRNYVMTRNCSLSTNNGATWGAPTVLQSGVSVVNQDSELIATNYLGDYDGLATDFTNVNRGFLGGFHDTLLGDQSVEAMKF
jgi:hypothetical protein